MGVAEPIHRTRRLICGRQVTTALQLISGVMYSNESSRLDIIVTIQWVAILLSQFNDNNISRNLFIYTDGDIFMNIIRKKSKIVDCNSQYMGMHVDS